MNFSKSHSRPGLESWLLCFFIASTFLSSVGSLCPRADRNELRVLLLWVLTTLGAVRDDDVGHLRATVGQPCDGAAGAEVWIVGMRGDDKDSLELGQPAVAACGRHWETG